ncbi:MAG: alcohol dehydrogenase catalytic domain-containing protein [Planctomycetota bacterium]|nr:alcohol dehydrogenase catalytic domain-containing protein [Planctomycetota bacterium]
MLAARLHGIRDIRLDSLPDPKEDRPPAGHVRVRIRAVGLCGSDLHYYREGRIADAIIREPTVLGHEAAGEVAAVGDGVTRLKPGDAVALEPGIPCMKCEYCQGGRQNLCSHIFFMGGPGCDGALRELLDWPEQLVEKLPGGVDFDEGAMLEPLGVALHALGLSGFRAGESVAVLGVGSIGMCVIELARASGASKMVAVEPLSLRRQKAVDLGCCRALDPARKNWREEARKTLDGGADLVVECSGNPDAIASIGTVARCGGRAVIIGIPAEDAVSFNPHIWRRSELAVYNCRRSNRTLPRCIALIRTRCVNLKKLISHRIPIKEVKEAFRLADERAEDITKMIITL